MELVNKLYASEVELTTHEGQGQFLAEVQRKLTLMLAPFAPFLAHELWSMLQCPSGLLHEPWPSFDPDLAKEEEVEVPIQVNGKLRSRVAVPLEITDSDLRDRAFEDEKIKLAIAGKELVKVLVVPGKMVSIVVK